MKKDIIDSALEASQDVSQKCEDILSEVRSLRRKLQVIEWLFEDQEGYDDYPDVVHTVKGSIEK